MRESRTAGGVVINNSTKLVLVVNQNGDSWSLPKGHVESGEDDLTAASREIAEESGVTQLTLIKKLGEYKRHGIGHGGKGDDVKEMKTLEMFLFTTDQQTLAPTDPQNPEARWVPREDVAAMLTHAKDVEFYLSVLDQLPK